MTPGQVTVVGASLAALSTVESLRRQGYSGRIHVIGEESWLPYDRPPLSKSTLASGDVAHPTYLRTEQQLTELDIDWQLQRRCVAVDVSGRLVLLDNGSSLPYESLVIATGARARTLPMLDRVAGVHRLRSFDDCRALANALTGSPSVVVIGGGFIGCEVAASLRGRGLDVTIVEILPTLLAGPLGFELGEHVAGWHRDHGVRLSCGVGVAGYRGARRIEAVELSDGRVLPADVVVLGLGASPNTEFLTGSAITIDNGVICDRFGRTQVPHVYAVGDVARAQDAAGRPTRVEHWTNATLQGAAVAANVLAGENAVTDVVRVPYFWSDQYGKRLQYIGLHDRGDSVHIDEADADRPVAVYERDGIITAALSVDRPRLLPRLRALIGQRLESGWPVAAAAPVGSP